MFDVYYLNMFKSDCENIMSLHTLNIKLIVDLKAIIYARAIYFCYCFVLCNFTTIYRFFYYIELTYPIRIYLIDLTECPFRENN